MHSIGEIVETVMSDNADCWIICSQIIRIPLYFEVVVNEGMNSEHPRSDVHINWSLHGCCRLNWTIKSHLTKQKQIIKSLMEMSIYDVVKDVIHRNWRLLNPVSSPKPGQKFFSIDHLLQNPHWSMTAFLCFQRSFINKNKLNVLVCAYCIYQI